MQWESVVPVQQLPVTELLIPVVYHGTLSIPVDDVVPLHASETLSDAEKLTQDQ